MTTALLFPGQGSQAIGMGREIADAFPEARRTFEEADDLLASDLSRICWEGPEEELTETRNAQPALLVHSIAVLRVVQERVGPIAMAAGHSLGEWSAHVAAGTLSFADGLRLVRLRGELMAAAGAARAGAMAAVLGLDDDRVEEICGSVSKPGAVVVAANFNSPGQVVISGDQEAVAPASEALRSAGARRVLPLKVSGAFHSPLMVPAEEGLREALLRVDFSAPSFPVVSNVTTALIESGDVARELLIQQLTSPVRWGASVSTMTAAGVDHFLELGSGSVLCGLNRRNAAGTTCASIGAPADLVHLEKAAG